MNSMYEMIMDLPLFKGVSKDQISLFLEKTHVGFTNYRIGAVMAEEGEPVNMVRFVISGEISLIHHLHGVDLTVEERVGFGKVLGADRLFGLNTGYPYKAVARTKTSIMEFPKSQYISLLHSDRIYMLNFLNYLSLRAQRPADALAKYCRGDIMDRIRQLVSVMTDPGSEEIVIYGGTEAISEFCDCDESNVIDWKNYLVREDLAKCDSNSVKILRRNDFLTH